MKLLFTSLQCPERVLPSRRNLVEVVSRVESSLVRTKKRGKKGSRVLRFAPPSVISSPVSPSGHHVGSRTNIALLAKGHPRPADERREGEHLAPLDHCQRSLLRLQGEARPFGIPVSVQGPPFLCSSLQNHFP